MDDTITADPIAIERRQLCVEITSAQDKFERASEQIKHMKRLLKDTKTRYKRAVSSEDERIGGNVRIRIMVLKGMLFVYHQYACLKSDEVLEKRMKLCNFSSYSQD